MAVNPDFEPNKDKLQTHEVDFADTKTSKLEAAINLTKILLMFVGVVWVLLTIGSVLNVSFINSEQAGNLSMAILPIIVTMATALLFYLIGRNQRT